jgi:ribonucleotide reductase beta subunit family protein with ferritin-like domain
LQRQRKINKDKKEDIKNMENILKPNSKRFSLLPVQHQDIWKMYKTAEASFWTAEEIDLAQDVSHWREKLNDNERYFIKHVLLFLITQME